jgi:DNA-binding protein HU-beta
LNEVLSTLSAAIKDGKRVILLGFGSFTVVERGPRNGRNPKTGEMVPIPSRRVIKFRPGKELSEKIL